jgi:hypothetical protein
MSKTSTVTTPAHTGLEETYSTARRLKCERDSPLVEGLLLLLVAQIFLCVAGLFLRDAIRRFVEVCTFYLLECVWKSAQAMVVQ